MIDRRFVRPAAVLLLALVSPAAGWGWLTSQEKVYEARARLFVPLENAAAIGTGMSPEEMQSIENDVLSADVVSHAVTFLQERGISLPYQTPLDSPADELLARTHVFAAEPGTLHEFCVTYQSTDASRTADVLVALIDAYLATRGVHETSAAESDDSVAEGEQLARAVEQQQTLVSGLEERLKSDGGPGQGEGHSTAIQAALAEARRSRETAEEHLTRVERELAAGSAIDAILARIPDDPAWKSTRDLMKFIRLERDVRQQTSAVQEAAAVYGRNHPRMLDLRRRLETLRNELAGVEGPNGGAASRDPMTGDPTRSAAELVLRALESRWKAARASEQDLQQKFDEEVSSGDTYEVDAAELADARAELTFLKEEHSRWKQQRDAAERELAAARPSVIEPATLAPEPVSPAFWPPIILASGIGWTGAFWLYRRGNRFAAGARRGALVADAPVASSATAAPPRERFLTQEEQQLARLKMLAGKA